MRGEQLAAILIWILYGPATLFIIGLEFYRGWTDGLVETAVIVGWGVLSCLFGVWMWKTKI
jgi:hypothetical protein